MKRYAAILMAAVVVAPLSFSDVMFHDGAAWQTQEGAWRVLGGRLAQTDAQASRAKANLAVTQSGVVEYAFDARYIGGAASNTGAFGVHLFVDAPHEGTLSWGNGRSFLLWLAWDPARLGGSGLFAQIYKSVDHSTMALHRNRGVTYSFEVPSEFLRGVTLDTVRTTTLPVRIRVDASDGDVWIKDPRDATTWFAFTLGEPVASGGYVTLRTSFLAASFDNLSFTRL